MAVDTASKALASLREDQSENDMAQSKRACGG